EILLGNEQRLEHRHRRCFRARPHVDPDETSLLPHLVSFGADLLLEVLRGRHVRHFEAAAFDVELPAVIDAADAILLVAAQEQRSATMRALMIEDADAT